MFYWLGEYKYGFTVNNYGLNLYLYIILFFSFI
jgi:hypothetical protein